MTIGTDQTVQKEECILAVELQYGQNYRGRPRYEQKYRNDFRGGGFRGNVRMYQNQIFIRQNYRG